MRVQIVSFNCVLKDQLGRVISSSFNQDVTPDANPNEANALPALAENLKRLKVGERKKFSISADEAYGFYDEALVKEVLRSDLKNGKKLKLNDLVLIALPSDQSAKNYRVIESSRNHVVLDANHPLAGQDLFFDIEMTASRMEENHDEVTNRRNN